MSLSNHSPQEMVVRPSEYAHKGEKAASSGLFSWPWNAVPQGAPDACDPLAEDDADGAGGWEVLDFVSTIHPGDELPASAFSPADIAALLSPTSQSRWGPSKSTYQERLDAFLLPRLTPEEAAAYRDFSQEWVDGPDGPRIKFKAGWLKSFRTTGERVRVESRAPLPTSTSPGCIDGPLQLSTTEFVFSSLEKGAESTVVELKNTYDTPLVYRFLLNETATDTAEDMSCLCSMFRVDPPDCVALQPGQVIGLTAILVRRPSLRFVARYGGKFTCVLSSAPVPSATESSDEEPQAASPLTERQVATIIKQSDVVWRSELTLALPCAEPSTQASLGAASAGLVARPSVRMELHWSYAPPVRKRRVQTHIHAAAIWLLVFALLGLLAYLRLGMISRVVLLRSPGAYEL